MDQALSGIRIRAAASPAKPGDSANIAKPGSGPGAHCIWVGWESGYPNKRQSDSINPSSPVAPGRLRVLLTCLPQPLVLRRSLVETGPKQTQPFFDVCRRDRAIAEHDPGWWARTVGNR
jgi:hypothetical protein